MIEVSEAFHKAWAEGKPISHIITFADREFHDEDISLSDGGVSYEGNFNCETDVTLGSCPSSSIRFTLLNDDGSLSGYDFGECHVKVGVLTDSKEHTYEYVDLGTFICNRPSSTTGFEVSLSGNDKMTLFDQPIDEELWKERDIQYPALAVDMVTALAYCYGIECGEFDTANPALTIPSEPNIFDGVTGRDTLGQLAEALGSIAYIDRHGLLRLGFFNQTEQIFDDRDYQTAEIGEFEVESVDRVVLRKSDSDIGGSIGDGTNTYIIQDNAFLAPETAEDAESFITPIYNRLSNFGSYVTCDADIFADPSVEAGDIVTVVRNGTRYKVPIFSVDFSGTGDVTISASGNPRREQPDSNSRKLYQESRKRFEVEQSIEGAVQTATEAQTKAEELANDVAQAQAQITAHAIVNTVTTSREYLESIAGVENRLEKKAETTAQTVVNQSAERWNLAATTSDNVNAYMDFSAEDQLVIGKSGSNTKTAYTNEGMTIYSGNNESAKFTIDGTQTKNLVAEKSIVIGNFIFSYQSGVGLSINTVRSADEIEV